jgi:hypothetical protein
MVTKFGSRHESLIRASLGNNYRTYESEEVQATQKMLAEVEANARCSLALKKMLKIASRVRLNYEAS